MTNKTPRYQLTEAERTIYRRYADLALPRHTSYPFAPVWKEDYGPDAFRTDVQQLQSGERDLSLYIHVPFCESLCYYCACNKEIVPSHRRQQLEPSISFLEGLALEARQLSCQVSPLRQVHLGGGSPTFLSPEQLRQLWGIVVDHFTIAADAEIAIEIDPRITTLEHLRTLADLGFNRISLGIQDFDPTVQRAVNRIQSVEQVQRCVDACRSLGLGTINFDLIYGLPFQTPESLRETLARTTALEPDRIAFYRLAVIPEMFRWQNTFRRVDLPSGEQSLDLNLLAINHFLEAGYEFVGLDHFARPDDPLAQARREGSLQRNFQGMTTGKGLDLLGLGPSAISQLDTAYAQNLKASTDWRQAVEHDLATERGLRLGDEDRLVRELIQQLYGHGIIDKRLLEERFGVHFDTYFADELLRLEELVGTRLVVHEPEAIRLVDPLGRLLVRVVAAVFDRYLPPTAFREGLAAFQASKVG